MNMLRTILSSLFLLSSLAAFASDALKFAPKSKTALKIYDNIGYTVGYSEYKGSGYPKWVAYVLTAPYKFEAVDALVPLQQDPRTSAKGKSLDLESYKGGKITKYKKPADYKISPELESRWPTVWGPDIGFGRTRTPLAPSEAIGKVYGKAAQLETGYSTNLRACGSDTHYVKYLVPVEQYLIKHLVPLTKNLLVITGACAGKLEGYPLLDRFRWMVLFYVKPRTGKTHMVGLLLPSGASKANNSSRFLMPSIRDCVVPVDLIEEFTGLDFFYQLPDAQENELEAKVDDTDFKYLK